MRIAIYKEIKRIGRNQRAIFFQETMDFCNGVEGFEFKGLAKRTWYSGGK